MKVGGEIVEGEGWLVGVFEVEVGFRCLVVMCLGEGGVWSLRWLRSLGIEASSWWLVVRLAGWLEELNVC